MISCDAEPAQAAGGGRQKQQGMFVGHKDEHWMQVDGHCEQVILLGVGILRKKPLPGFFESIH